LSNGQEPKDKNKGKETVKTLLVATLGAVSRTLVTDTTTGKKYFVDGKPTNIREAENGKGFTADLGDGNVTFSKMDTRSLEDIKPGSQFIKISNGATYGVKTIGSTLAQVGALSSRGGFLKGSVVDMSLAELVTECLPIEFRDFLGQTGGTVIEDED
jgi:hypothetical protein